MRRFEIVNDIKERLAKGETLGRHTVKKLYGVSEQEARVVLEIAKFLVELEQEKAKINLKHHIELLKFKEQKERLREQLVLELLSNAVKVFEPPKITQKTRKVRVRGEEVAVILLSDWHIGEVVRAEAVSNVNAFNKYIAGARLEYLCDKIAELVELQRSYTNINKAIVWFGGDIVSGLIHDELIKSADITAVEQVAVAGYLLAQVVAELSTVFDHIEVITTVGNHGRLAKRKEYKFSVLENFDYIAYQICALALRKYRNVKFNISKAIFRFEDIAGWRFVFSHGDETRSWMSIPFYGLKRDFANKNILNAYLAGLQTQVQPVNYKVVGHFHISGFIPEGGGYIIMNGTLKGIDEYAFTHGWITRPSQIIFGVHQEYGITWNYSIWLDVVKKENPSRFVVDLPDTWADLVI